MRRLPEAPRESARRIRSGPWSEGTPSRERNGGTVSARINTSERPPSEVLMESLAEVEGAQRVVILMEKDSELNIKTNCTHREIDWILRQASHCNLRDLFAPSDE